MKKALVLIPLALFFIFTFVFLAGLSLGKLISQARSDEIMPFELLGRNDSFNLKIRVDQKGKTQSLTYGYEYAD
jgi:hypothetical protein